MTKRFFLSLAALTLSQTTVADPVPMSVFDPSAMNKSVDPCQDFYQYSCGDWIKKTKLPSDQSVWARSFSVVDEQNLAILKTILSDYSKGHYDPPTPYQQKLGAFYASCMDESQVEKDSPRALAEELKQIDQLSTLKDLPQLLGQLHLKGINVFFNFGHAGDLIKPKLEIGEIDQGGLGLPDSTFYKRTDPSSVQLRKKYIDHISKMFVLAGAKLREALIDADNVMALEQELAGSALPPEDLQDPTKLYHPGSVGPLQSEVPSVDWAVYFQTLDIRTPTTIDITEPKFMGAFENILKNTKLEKIRTYMKWHMIEEMGPFLGKKIYGEWFNFNGKILDGQQKPKARWKRCVRSVGGGMGEAVGQAFVAKTFSPQAKERALALISNLTTAFQQDLQTLTWLDDPTRKAALAKLKLITRKIGYPDKWRNYDKLEISKESYWGNVARASIFESHRQLNKIGGSVDPLEWAMTPQMVNAYYNPNQNNINFPAGILQIPFFSEKVPDSNNYGAIGMVIGHEMTHGFDTTGSKFDGEGAKNDWWSPAVKTLFETKAQCLKDQYNKYSPLPGLSVNGNLTITENIADQGGLKLAYSAFKLASAGKPEETPVAGLNQNQQFFISMAQMWCQKQSDESLKKQVSSNPHSPAQYRVNGPISESADFAAAFNCKAGTPMAPVNRCSIW